MSYQIEIEQAKNGQLTLKVNGYYYYSKYNPARDVQQQLATTMQHTAKRYVVFGFGLGYHADYILQQNLQAHVVIVETETAIFEHIAQHVNIQSLLQHERVEVVHQLQHVQLHEGDAVFITAAWQKGLVNRELQHVLQNYTISQSLQHQHELLEHNYHRNIVKDFNTITPLQKQLQGQTAILVSAGPSLDTQIEFLKRHQHDAFILCVAAATDTLKKHDITPHAIITVDPNPVVMRQKIAADFQGLRFYGITVYPDMWHTQEQRAYALFQKGLSQSEAYAQQHQLHCLDVGGSVATWALSVLFYMQPATIILVGQDLAYVDGKTHAQGSSSQQTMREIHASVKVKNNAGGYTPTANSWEYFRTSFEQQIAKHPSVNVYNTSLYGAKIAGAAYLQHPASVNFSFNEEKFWQNIELF